MDDEYLTEYEEGQRIALHALKTMIDLMRLGKAKNEVLDSVDDMQDYLKLMLYSYLEGYLRREKEDETRH